MSLHRMSSGAGYKYLTRSTACADVHRDAADPLTGYYTSGYAPTGRWIGRGLQGLADDGRAIRVGDEVAEVEMARLFGAGSHPLTGKPLGRARPASGSAIVSGFDLTFTVPKSASVLWALGEAHAQDAVQAANRAAVADLLRLIEDRALFTRTGMGGVMQLPTRGMLAAAFDHWDTRHGDPNLHTHAVIANRVQGPDGRWRTIDSKALHLAAVAMSEMYDDIFADHLASRLPIKWGFRHRGRNRTPGFEVEGLPDRLLAAFSTRSTSITAELDRLRAKFHADHGRGPSRREVVKLRQQATLATRPAKIARPLGELRQLWAITATRLTGKPLPAITAEALSQQPNRRLRSKQVGRESVDRIADQVCTGLLERRSVFTEWNMWAEAARATRGLRMSTIEERTVLIERIVTATKAVCTPLEAPQLLAVPDQLRREDGASVFTRAGESRWAHPSLISAEQQLIAGNADHTAPAVPAAYLPAAGDLRRPPQITNQLAPDQLDAVRAIAASGRRIDVLVGPAGAGKTTTLKALRLAWERGHGQGSVIGLAPSANAARQLAEALTIPTENTAKWLHETIGPGADHRQATLDELAARRPVAMESGDFAAVRRIDSLHQRLITDQQSWSLRAGQLLIVDEASLAGTMDLAALTRQAVTAGAKVLLVGDHAQLGSVTAGGGFGLLARSGTANHLSSLWRFTNPWEATATRHLRTGDLAAIDAYMAHDRVSSGERDAMIDDAFHAWTADRESGVVSIMVASDNVTVQELNIRAHDRAIANGTVTGPTIDLGGVCQPERGQVGAGDTIVTRANDRNLSDGSVGHVRNGSLWRVTCANADGTLDVTAIGNQSGGSLRLPADYVAEHVELGYATTAHRAQGMTVDTAHVIAGPGTGRETFYVAMTRGRNANHAYLIDSDEDCMHETRLDARSLLTKIVGNSQAELSATETFIRNFEQATSLSTLAPIRASVDAMIDADTWPDRLMAAGIHAQQVAQLAGSERSGAIFAALRRGEELGYDMPRQLARLLKSGPHGQESADRVYGELSSWVATAADLNTGALGTGHGHPLAGHAPQAGHPLDQTLDQIDALIEGRTTAISARSAATTTATPKHSAGPNSRDRAALRYNPTRPRIAQSRIHAVQEIA